MKARGLLRETTVVARISAQGEQTCKSLPCSTDGGTYRAGDLERRHVRCYPMRTPIRISAALPPRTPSHAKREGVPDRRW